jgi:methylated-DNA-[protein]-cysteine S-methyltransferase
MSVTRSDPILVSQMSTIAGTLTLVVDPDIVGDRGPTEYGAVVASGFSSIEDISERLTPEQRKRIKLEPLPPPELERLIDAYNSGDVDSLYDVSVSQPGGPFMQQAWIALRDVKAGQTDSYTGLALRAGRPTAVRAAGTACSSNMVAPFVPCHRILRSDGTLGGYYYGLTVKESLLAHERGQSAMTPADPLGG